jgi:uncharacterized protein
MEKTALNIVEKDVEIAGTPTLRGTLALPEGTQGRIPGVLIIQGSGKIDRNGTVAKPRIDLNAYRQLSDFIAGLGYATLRYDKRGVGASGGDYMTSGMWDLVDDAERALEFLAAQPNVDPQRVVVLGHSEGATIVTALNAHRPANGVILLSGGGERLEEALQRQRDIAHADMNKMQGFKGMLIRALKVTEKSEKTSQKLMRKMKETDKAVIRFNMAPINAKWFREHLAYDVVADLPALKCPVLAVTGGADVQADAEKLKRVVELAEGEAEIYTVTDMDHGLKHSEPGVTMMNYRKVIAASGAKPLHEELEEILAHWLTKHFPIHA